MDNGRGEQATAVPGPAGGDVEGLPPLTAADKEIGVAPDELVVGLPQWRLVAGALDALGVWPAGMEPIAQDERLGLALLSGFANLAGAADRIRADHRAEIAALETTADRTYEPIDLLLFGLRRYLRDNLAGYVPPLGKNRTGFLVVGWPYPKGMRAATFPDVPAKPPPAPAASALGAGVRVGVLDTPVSAHPDLAGRFLTTAPGDVLRPVAAGLRSYRAGHGTFVADLIRRQAPAVQIEAHGLLSSETGRATLWDTALAILSLGNAGIDVLNLSLGCLTGDDEPPLLIQRALDRVDPEVVVVAAAGNHGRTGPHGPATVSPAWPAALDRVVAVGATGAGFSAYGPWVTCTAPGENLTAAYLSEEVTLTDQVGSAAAATPAGQLGNDPQHNVLLPDAGAGTTRHFSGYATWSGTSFAAAWVSGAIAARTVPGRVSAREALDQLLPQHGPDIKRVHYRLG